MRVEGMRSQQNGKACAVWIRSRMHQVIQDSSIISSKEQILLPFLHLLSLGTCQILLPCVELEFTHMWLFSFSCLSLLGCFTVVAAWNTQPRPPVRYNPTAARREVFVSIASSLVAAGATVVAVPPAAIAGDVDYSKVQDLLGGSATPYVPEPGRRPTYLSEPTDEFKENESKSAAYKRQNLALKAKFNEQLEIMMTAPNSEDKLSAALDSMRLQVKSNGGLPSGISKEEVVKTCRRRKAQRYWPTNVEIS